MSAKGVHAFALDLNPAMLAYAASKVKAGASITFIQADMTNFSMTDCKVDLAALLFGSLMELDSNEAMLSCMRNVQSNLTADGLFVVEMAGHPEDFFSGEVLRGLSWTAQRKKASKLEVQFGGFDDAFNAQLQIRYTTVNISEHVQHSDDFASAFAESEPKLTRCLLSRKLSQRLHTFQELLLMAQMAGFRLVAAYDHMNDPLNQLDVYKASSVSALMLPFEWTHRGVNSPLLFFGKKE